MRAAALSILAILPLASCQSPPSTPPTPSVTPKPPPASSAPSHITHRIQQVVPQADGADLWSNERLWEYRRTANLAFSKTIIRFEWENPLRIENAQLRAGIEVFPTIERLSGEAYRERGVISVYHLDKLVFRGAEYGGLGNLPGRWGIAVSSQTTPGVMPHELGHYFGVLHYFDDSCNIMGYRFYKSESADCIGIHSFTADQRSVMAGEAVGGTRIKTVIGAPKRSMASARALTKHLPTILCPLVTP